MTNHANAPTVIRNRDGSTTILNLRFGHGERLRLASSSEVPPNVQGRAMEFVAATREAEYRRAAARVAMFGDDRYAASLFRRDLAAAEESARLAADHCRAAIDAWDHLAVVMASGRLVWISESDRRVLNLIRMDGLVLCGGCAGVGRVATDDGPGECEACGGVGLESTYVPVCVKAALDRLSRRVEANALRRVAVPTSAPEPSNSCVAAIAAAAGPDIAF